MAIKYSQKVIEEFSSPENVGQLEGANATATEGSPACGDMITFTMNIDEESHVIEDIRFLSYGCASNIATASMASKIAKGKTIEEIKKLNAKSVTEALDGLPAVKIHCSVLAIKGLKSAIHEWEVEQGLAEPKSSSSAELSKRELLDALREVIHPQTGVDLVTMNMVKRIALEGEDKSRVFVELEMAQTEEMFYENIEEETREHLEELEGVTGATIKLSERQLLDDEADDD